MLTIISYNQLHSFRSQKDSAFSKHFLSIVFLADQHKYFLNDELRLMHGLFIYAVFFQQITDSSLHFHDLLRLRDKLK